MKKAIAIALLLLVHASAGLAAVWSAGPTVTLTGRIFDDSTGQPLSGAQVTLEDTPYGGLTDTRGVYRLLVPREHFPANPRLGVQRIGFEPTSVPIGIAEDLVATDLWLAPASLHMDAAVVTAESAGSGAAAPATTEQIQVTGSATRAAGSPAPPPPPPTGLMPSPGGVRFNTENYARIEENRFQDPRQEPLSTFSIDVDRASYSNVRRFLRDGMLPPPDAVRIEEMINYFPYSYPTGEGDHPFGVDAEVAAAPWAPNHQLLRIGLASTPVDIRDLPPSNLVFLLDVSGSMMDPNKLPLVKQSLRMLVDELREDDRVAMVVYAGAAGLVLPSTPGSDRRTILEAIEKLEAGGSTAGGEGLRLAYRIARENHLPRGNNRIILATDGDFNVGVSSDAEMIRLVEERRSQGTYLTVLGFGTGNLKDSRMEQMADHGNGNYAYIDSALEARKVLVTEMGGTLLTVARDVKLQVEFNPARVQAYRLIGYENRMLAAEDFNDDRKDAGELGAGHTVTALYEIVPVGVEMNVDNGSVDPLRYSTPRAEARGGSDELAFVRVRYAPPTGSPSILMERAVRNSTAQVSQDFRFTMAVAGFGMLLRDSEHAGNLTIGSVESMARRGIGEDRGGYRADFLELLDQYRQLSGGLARGETRVH